MKRLLFISIIPFTLYSTELKIAAYNVENLFDNVKNGTEYEEYIPNKHNWTNAMVQKKIEHTTRVICDLNADVIGLEEIENSNALKLLQEHLNRVGCRYRYSAITHKSGSAIQVALLSKVKISKSKDIRVSYSSSDRDILEVTLKTKPKLTIFVNHWRSKRAPESARLKYAKALVKEIKKMPKNSEYIILGDFNSDYNECNHMLKKDNNTNGICGIDTILHTYNNKRFIKLRDRDINATFYNYNLWSDLPAHERWSHDFYGEKGSIDSIIIPPTLLDKSGWFYEMGSFKVFKKRYLFKKNKRNSIYRWVYKNSKHMGKGYSDHLPIYAIFANSTKKELKHESLLDKFWKLILPHKENDSKKVIPTTLKELTINQLSKWKYLKNAVILKDACVIYKRGDFGVIKSSTKSKSITLYKSADGLEEGRCYDFKVYKKKKYYGLDEITDLDIVKKKNKIDIEKFIPKFSNVLMAKKVDNIGDIVKDIEGVYRDKYINVNNRSYNLYVKQKRKGLLKKNSHLYIKKAQIGYYKGEKELIVYSLDDISKEN